MKKTFLFIAVACGVALLTACGGSGNGDATNDGILGELDEYVQDFYAKGNAAAAYDQRTYQNEGDKDKDKAEKLRDEVLDSYDRLVGVLDKAVGRELTTEVREGTPLKVVTPFTVKEVEFRSDAGGKLKLSEEPDEKLRRGYNGYKLENAFLRVSLEAELELTEDIKAQTAKMLWAGTVRSFDNLIQSCGVTAADSILFCGAVGTSFDYGVAQKAGTHLIVKMVVEDGLVRPYDKAESEFRSINIINQVNKAYIEWEATTSATLADDGVKGELGLFELQGPVKKCTVINDWGNIVRTFDEQGFWKTHDGKALSAVYPGGIVRDDYGRIIKGNVDGEGNGEDYSYNKFGKIVKYNCHIYDSIEEDVYTYDDKGNLLKKHIETRGMDAEEPYDETYTDVITDSHGNWTSRKANGTLQKRKVEYYN